METLGGMYADGRQGNCSSRPDSEEEDRATPQEPSLRDTQHVLGAYVAMYIAKERERSIAQVGTLANTLLVQYMYKIKFKNQ
jgi:hypothetical protein